LGAYAFQGHVKLSSAVNVIDNPRVNEVSRSLDQTSVISYFRHVQFQTEKSLNYKEQAHSIAGMVMTLSRHGRNGTLAVLLKSIRANNHSQSTLNT